MSMSQMIRSIEMKQETQAVQLEDDKILEVLADLPPHMLQGRRMVEYLGQKPKTSTGELAHSCSIGNLSDVAHYVNPYLVKHNLFIGCEKPLRPIINKFNEESNQFLWSVHSVPEAANDESYSQQ